MGEIRVKTADGWQTLPAHQKTSTGWKDIPTHTMTANGWHGELTSQAPLEFKATGQSLLDWRVDGRTSGNLFDVVTFNQYAIHNRCTSTTDGHNLTITATESGDCYLNPTVNVGTAIYNDTRRNTLIPCKPNTTYTLYRENAERIYTYWASVDSSYTVTKSSAVSDPLTTFTTDADAKYIYLRLGNAGTLPLDTPVTLQNIRLMEGTYTSSTIPPYEPYGGVGVRTENLWNESYPDITGASITYLPLLVGEGTFTMSSDFDASSTGFTDLFFLAGNVSSGAGTATNGVYSGTSRTQTAIDGYITIAYRLSSTNDIRKAHTMLNAGSTALPYTPYGYKIPITVNGTTTNLYTTSQLMDGDSLDFATDQTSIPITQGDNTLTVGTAVQPSKVFVKFEG